LLKKKKKQILMASDQRWQHARQPRPVLICTTPKLHKRRHHSHWHGIKILRRVFLVRVLPSVIYDLRSCHP
jgi:hypothetical protein